MVKQKKKRNKVYRGNDAALIRPTITRVSAVNRNRLQQWWFEKKGIAKPLSIATGVAIFVIWLIFELFRTIG